jgi:hypothetical protein
MATGFDAGSISGTPILQESQAFEVTTATDDVALRTGFGIDELQISPLPRISCGELRDR